ncbi:hypothetical protein H2248_002972 [Termitomyces sp. 'cryptogamus']|nr:hypothetical protein H2248_002972 [Termitomyces sp. 'cryptogamus']
MSRTRDLIALASILLLVVSAKPVVTNQHFLDVPTTPDFEPLSVGRLWRFDVDSSEVFKDVIDLVNTHDLDLWHIGHTHLDIYTPNSALALPEGLLRLQPSLLANISLPAIKPPRSHTKWDLSSLQNTTFHADYHPLSEINEFIQEIARLRPNLVKLKNVGLSGMGREMLSLVISNGEATAAREQSEPVHSDSKEVPSEQKLSFVIIGAQHAREWIATSASLYLAHALVSDLSEPYSLSRLLNVFDFYIIPVPNPDGYEYTWEKDRFWYKTRQQVSPKSDCVGIDMNRNWGYKWKALAEEQSRKPRHRGSGLAAPCSHWYPGHRPFEAPEVNNIANMVSTIPNLVGFLDLRSYGQMLSSPFSYSCSSIPKDAEDQLEAGLGGAWTMSQVYGTTVTTGSLCSNLYRAPGNVIDWMYKRAGIKYSYALHLRDTGTYGFTLPARWIRPVGEETSAMLEYLTKFIAMKMKRDFGDL